MTSHVEVYKGYTIDYTPFHAGKDDTGNDVYGATAKITNNHPNADGMTSDFSDLVERGSEEDMAAYGKAYARKWVDDK